LLRTTSVRSDGEDRQSGIYEALEPDSLNNQKDQGRAPTYTSQAQISFGRKSAGKLREVSDRRLYLVQPSPKSPWQLASPALPS
jgi:hypothetical protein